MQLCLWIGVGGRIINKNVALAPHAPFPTPAAYRKLALAHHPDKGGAADAAAFARAATAHAILADPARRAAHDAALRSGGGAASEPLDNITVDPASLSVVDAACLSLFAKLGVRVAHAPPPSLLEAARVGDVAATHLPWTVGGAAAAADGATTSAALSGTVDRGAAAWFEVPPPPAGTSASAFAAYSRGGSRVQLLLFEPSTTASPSGWDLVAAADSTPTVGGGQLAALFPGLPFATLRLEPPSSAAAADAALAIAGATPAARVLRSLDGMTPRETLPLVTGASLLAVVGGNMWRRAAFTVRAVAIEEDTPPAATAAPPTPIRDPLTALRAAEDALLAKRSKLGGLEAGYRAAEAALKKAADEIAAAGGEVDALLAARDAAYLDVLGLLPGPAKK